MKVDLRFLKSLMVEFGQYLLSEHDIRIDGVVVNGTESLRDEFRRRGKKRRTKLLKYLFGIIKCGLREEDISLADKIARYHLLFVSAKVYACL